MEELARDSLTGLVAVVSGSSWFGLPDQCRWFSFVYWRTCCDGVTPDQDLDLDCEKRSGNDYWCGWFRASGLVVETQTRRRNVVYNGGAAIMMLGYTLYLVNCCCVCCLIGGGALIPVRQQRTGIHWLNRPAFLLCPMC